MHCEGFFFFYLVVEVHEMVEEGTCQCVCDLWLGCGLTVADISMASLGYRDRDHKRTMRGGLSAECAAITQYHCKDQRMQLVYCELERTHLLYMVFCGNIVALVVLGGRILLLSYSAE
jgi:hypothetical protein